jgi:hypothetical protein
LSFAPLPMETSALMRFPVLRVAIFDKDAEQSREAAVK